MLHSRSPRSLPCRLLFFCLLIFSLFPPLRAQHGQALLFDGAADYFSTPDNDSLDYQGALTLSAWIHPNCNEGLRVLISKQWCQGDYGYYFGIRDNRLIWSYNDEGNCNSPNSVTSRDTLFEEMRWYHIAVTHNQDSIVLYVDGVEVPQVQREGRFSSIRNSSQPFLIGGYRYLGGEVGAFFSGLADELRLWSTTLSAAEIAAEAGAAAPLRSDGGVLSIGLENVPPGPVNRLTNELPGGPAVTATAQGAPRIVPIDFYEEDLVFGIQQESDCGESATLSVAPAVYSSIVWSTGEEVDEIVVTEAGEYAVTVSTETCRFYSDTVTVSPGGGVLTEIELSYCPGDSVRIGDRYYSAPGTLTDTLTAARGCDSLVTYTVTERLPDTVAVDLPVCTLDSVAAYGTIVYPGQVNFVNSPVACDTVYAVSLTYAPAARRDTTLLACTATSPVAYAGRQLQAGDSLVLLTRTRDNCDSVVVVRVAVEPATDLLPDSLTVCGSGIMLSTGQGAVDWGSGEAMRELYITEPGSYTATMNSAAGCTVRDTVEVEFAGGGVFVPNAFSPNGDGQNDCFGPLLSPQAAFTAYHFAVHDRWGALLFESEVPGECWDGRSGTRESRSQQYVWYLEYAVGGCTDRYRMAGSLSRLP